MFEMSVLIFNKVSPCKCRTRCWNKQGIQSMSIHNSESVLCNSEQGLYAETHFRFLLQEFQFLITIQCGQLEAFITIVKYLHPSISFTYLYINAFYLCPNFCRSIFRGRLGRGTLAFYYEGPAIGSEPGHRLSSLPPNFLTYHVALKLECIKTAVRHLNTFYTLTNLDIYQYVFLSVCDQKHSGSK